MRSKQAQRKTLRNRERSPASQLISSIESVQLTSESREIAGQFALEFWEVV
jgi:hypothetical protein